LRKKINILGKRTGLGNQIQFIPIVNMLLKEYEIASDSDVFYQLGILKNNQFRKADINITVFGYNHKKLWTERKKRSGKFYGFKYRIKGKHIGLGYSKSLAFDENVHETINNLNLYNYCFGKQAGKIDFTLPGRHPEAKTIVIAISPKKEKTLPDATWRTVISILKNQGYKVLVVDHNPGVREYIQTPSLKDLKETLSRAEFYIGTDSGVMHLADILGIPSLVVFGSTSIKKNGPLHPASRTITKNLTCSPCFDWGRINCKIDYECMKFDASEIVHSFNTLIANKI